MPDKKRWRSAGFHFAAILLTLALYLLLYRWQVMIEESAHGLSHYLWFSFCAPFAAFLSALLFQAERIAALAKGRGRLRFRWENLLFALVCFFLSLMPVWMYTLFSAVPVQSAVLTGFLTKYTVWTVAMGFAAGVMLLKAFAPREE